MADIEKLLKAMECSLRPCRKRDNCKECKYRLLEKVDGRIPCPPDVEEDGIEYWDSCDCDGMVKDAIETIRELQELTKELSETRTSNPMYELGYKKGATDMEKAKQIIIDKLQEQLEKARGYLDFNYKSGYEQGKKEAISELMSTSSLFNQGYICGVHDTEIKAKKQDSKEVCEWVKASEDDMSIWKYYPKCEGMTDVDISGFHYCPYCGRKIKVVE